MVHWQLVIVWLCVGGAVLFLVRRGAAFFGGGGGCGSSGCGGCSSGKSDGAGGDGGFVPLDALEGGDENGGRGGE